MAERQRATGGGRPRVCVIGAGSSGIASCQVLQRPRDSRSTASRRAPRSAATGVIMNDNGMSSAYESLSHQHVSRKLMAYAELTRCRTDYPDYPNHSQIAAYFDATWTTSASVSTIRFHTEVDHVEPACGRGLERDPRRRHHQPLRLGARRANGHHWDARWPEPPFPGEFNGRQMHAHDYKTPDGFEDKNVLVLGHRQLRDRHRRSRPRACRNMTFLAMRRGAYVIPKYLKGQPTDQLGTELTSRAAALGPALRCTSACIKTAPGRPMEALRPPEAGPQAARGPPHHLLRPAARASGTAASP